MTQSEWGVPEDTVGGNSNQSPEPALPPPREFSAYLRPPGTQKAGESRAAVLSFVPLLALQRENRHQRCKVKCRPGETQKPRNPTVLGSRRHRQREEPFPVWEGSSREARLPRVLTVLSGLGQQDGKCIFPIRATEAKWDKYLTKTRCCVCVCLCVCAHTCVCTRVRVCVAPASCPPVRWYTIPNSTPRLLVW